jgi:hypothetical protein
MPSMLSTDDQPPSSMESTEEDMPESPMDSCAEDSLCTASLIRAADRELALFQSASGQIAAAAAQKYSHVCYSLLCCFLLLCCYL